MENKTQKTKKIVTVNKEQPKKVNIFEKAENSYLRWQDKCEKVNGLSI